MKVRPNLALLSPETRSQLVRGWWLAPIVGLATALAIMAADFLFFGGATMRRMPDLSAHPPIGSRVLVALLGSLFEEVVFRAGVATLSAWLVYRVWRHVRAAQWTGVLVAVVAIGFIHLGNPSEVWRVMTINVIGHTVYGWLYWRRGLEMAFLAHTVVTAILYIGVPALR